MLALLYPSSIAVYPRRETTFVLTHFFELRFICGCYGSEASRAATLSACGYQLEGDGVGGVKQFKDAPIHIGTPTEGPSESVSSRVPLTFGLSDRP